MRLPFNVSFRDATRYSANMREAMREGAEFLMVKPAMAYTDIIQIVRDNFRLLVVAYNVSGEYSMVKAAAANGWIDEKAVALELLTGLKRAGADLIMTYFAKNAVRWLQEK